MSDDFSSYQTFVEKADNVLVTFDTCSLIANDAPEVTERMAKEFPKSDKKIFLISKAVENERKNSPNVKKFINKSKAAIINMQKYLTIYQDSANRDVNFADNDFIQNITYYRMKYNVVLITNDKNLAADILALNYSKSVDRTKTIKVFAIKNNSLEEYKIPEAEKERINPKPLPQSSEPKVVNAPKAAPAKKVEENSQALFKIEKKPYLNDELNEVKEIPYLGSSVKDSDGQEHRLLKEIGSGAEAKIYKTDTNFVAKIFAAKYNTKFKEKKIELLIESKIKVKKVAFPLKILLNSYGEFVGYLMREVQGIRLDILMNHIDLEKYFPNWDKKNLVNLAISIAKTVDKLHKKGIILGDINPLNILVVDDKNLAFVDTDSFQISFYPCTVGMLPYTRRENHGKPYESYLRTEKDDSFALISLIFRLFFLGKSPYAHRGGSSVQENFHPQFFPYPYEPKHNYDNVPLGYYKYIWSNLPWKFKEEVFVASFAKEKYCTLATLLSNLDSYSYQLENSYQSSELCPNDFKVLDEDKNPINNFVESFCSECKGKIKLSNVNYEKRKESGNLLCEVCESKKVTSLDFNNIVKTIKSFF